MSSEIAKQEGGVPALVTPTPLEIGVEDMVFPRVKIGHYSSGAVQEGLVGAGDIYTATSADDPEPQVLWQYGSDGPGPVIYVLGMRRGKSDDSTGELVRYEYSDPSAPASAWVTYNYVVAIPSVDAEVPFKLLLTRSGKSCAQRINSALRRRSNEAPWNMAWEIKTVRRQNEKGKWFVPQETAVKADPDHIMAAGDMASVIFAEDADVDPLATTGDEPAI